MCDTPPLATSARSRLYSCLILGLSALAAPAVWALDPQTPVVRDAYLGAATPEKANAALAGLNDLLASAFTGKNPDLSGGFYASAGTTIYGLFLADSSDHPLVFTTVNASADSDLGAPNNPLLLDGTALNVLASFSSERAVSIGLHDAIINTNAFNLILSGDLTADGLLRKEGTGVLELTGNNSWHGISRVFPQLGIGLNATPTSVPNIFIDDGTLRGNATSLAANIATRDAGSSSSQRPVVEFAQAVDGIYAGKLSGTLGTLLKTGAGTLTLTGDNSKFGATQIGAGRIVLGATGNLGGGALTLASGTELDISAAHSIQVGALSGQGLIRLGPNSLFTANTGTPIFGGTIAGSGGLTVSGRLQLTGINTYTGTTAVNGILSLVGAGNLNEHSALSNLGSFDISAADGDRVVAGLSGTGQLNLGANRLTFGGNNSAGFYSGGITGSGGITKVGTGRQSILGTSGYTGETQILNGAVLASPHALSADILNNAELEFTYAAKDPSGSAITDYTGTIHGTGHLIKSGDGVLWLRGINSYTGGTEVRAGALVGNTQSLQSNINNHAVLAFYQIDDGDYAGTVSGEGTLLKYGPGRVTLSGISTHTGSTAFTGPLRITSDASLGAPTTPLIAVDGALELAGNVTATRSIEWIGTNTLRTNEFDFTATHMVGSGALTKMGSGALSLNGIQSFSGMLQIAEGSLQLNGSIAGPVAIAAGATVAGTGRIGGPLTLAAGSIYTVAAQADGTSTALQVAPSATASIAGSLVRVAAAPGDYALRTRYTILAAPGGINGQFQSATSNLAFLTPELSYDPTTAYLTLARNDTTFRDLASHEQRALGGALDTLGGNTTADGVAVDAALHALTTAEVPTALAQLTATALPTISIAGSAQQHLVSRQIGARLGGLASAGGFTDLGAPAFDREPLLAASDGESTLPVVLAALTAVTSETSAMEPSTEGFWMRGLAGRGDYEVVNTRGLRSHTTGFVAGYDNRVNAALTLGTYLGFTDSTLRLREVTSRSDNSIESWRFGLYGRWQQGPAHLDAQLGYTRDSFDSARGINVGALQRTAKANFDGDAYNADLEFGYVFGRCLQWEPFVGLEWNRQHTDDYQEQGAGVLDLALNEHTDDEVRSRLGARVRFVPHAAPLSLELSAAWAHEYTNLSRFGARLVGDATQTLFTVSGTAAPRDSAEVGAELRGQITKNTRAFLAFDSELNSAAQTYTVSGGFRVSW